MEQQSQRTGKSVADLKRALEDNLFFVLGRLRDAATPHNHYMAAACAVRDRLVDRWIRTARTYRETGARTVCYLSAEFLLGPHLENNLINLGIRDVTRRALA